MVTSRDTRAFDLYLLLLAHSQLTGTDEFFLSLEDMGLSLGLPKDASPTDLRRQVKRSLRKLSSRYHLLDVEFFYAKNALIRLAPVPGETFTVSSGFLVRENKEALTIRLQYFLMIHAFLKAKGEDIDSISQRGLARRFNVSDATIRGAMKDLNKLKE